MANHALQFTFTFSTIAEAEQFLAALKYSVPKQLTDDAQAALQSVAAAEQAPTDPPAAETLAESDTPEAPKRKRGRPKKNSTTAATPEAPATATPPAAAAATDPPLSNPSAAARVAAAEAQSTGTPTADDVREALYVLTSTAGKSMADGLAALKTAGVQRVPELQPEQYASVIADCRARAAV